MFPVEKEKAADRYDFASAERDFMEGGWSINALAAKHGIPEPTLRRHAKRNFWRIGGSAEIKREMVRQAMAGTPLDQVVLPEGVTNGDELVMTNDADLTNVRQEQVVEARQDVADMNRGLAVARACMAKLLAMASMVSDPRDVKVIVEANKAAVETIRKIRELDDEPVGPQATVSVEIGGDFADLRAAFQKRLEQASGGEIVSET